MIKVYLNVEVAQQNLCFLIRSYNVGPISWLLPKAQNRRLRKQGILCLRQAHFTSSGEFLVVSQEFCGKQSHELGPVQPVCSQGSKTDHCEACSSTVLLDQNSFYKTNKNENRWYIKHQKEDWSNIVWCEIYVYQTKMSSNFIFVK